MQDEAALKQKVRERVMLKLMDQKRDILAARIETFKQNAKRTEELETYAKSIESQFLREMQIYGVEMTPAIEQRINEFKLKLHM